MLKDKLRLVQEYIVKHSKVVFPIIVIAAVAVTVTIALNAGNENNSVLQGTDTTGTATESTEQALEPVSREVPLVQNEDANIYALIATYYNAVALGDTDTIASICDVVTETEILRYKEMANYIESYPVLEVYTKPGYEEGSTIAYVYYKVTFNNQTEQSPGYQAHYICTNEQGELYLKKGESSDAVNEYIGIVSSQDDVVDFNNRITVEYNELMVNHPELLEYLNELTTQVNKSVGEILAQQAAAATESTAGGEGETPETPADGTTPSEETPAEPTIQYATATDTVNVRVSDSELAERLGKVATGTQLQLLEQRANGWSKVLYDNQEGYIKSEFLQVSASTGNAESADGTQSIGTVTATTNINVRASASETAERLGVLAGGESAELLANENGWSKINYNGQVGYVKSEFVQ